MLRPKVTITRETREAAFLRCVLLPSLPGKCSFFAQQVPGTFPAGLGEPLNAIILGSSDETVLVDQETDGGLRNYFL